MKKGAVTGVKVKNGSPTGADVNAPALAPGAVTGAALAAGIPHDVHTVRSLGSVRSAAEHRDFVQCPEGEQVMVAVAPFFGATGFVALTGDGPVEEDTNSDTYNGWTGQTIEVNGGSTQVWAIEVYAVCAKFCAAAGGMARRGP